MLKLAPEGPRPKQTAKVWRAPYVKLPPCGASQEAGRKQDGDTIGVVHGELSAWRTSTVHGSEPQDLEHASLYSQLTRHINDGTGAAKTLVRGFIAVLAGFANGSAWSLFGSG